MSAEGSSQNSPDADSHGSEDGSSQNPSEGQSQNSSGEEDTENRTVKMAAHIGTISEYNPDKEDFYMYKKRLEVWMKVNKIDNDDKAQVFRAIVGPSAFEIITNMCIPDDPATTSYADVIKIAETHFRVSRNTVTERVVFRERKQKVGESISQYIVELKMLSRHCNYGEQLSENL